MAVIFIKMNFRIIIAVVMLIGSAVGALYVLYILADLLEKTFRNNLE